MESVPFPASYKVVNQEGNEAVFEIEGLYPGYGLTLGNALRRVLLSSLPGAAITLVKIKSISHEFSTIPMVYEDVIEILLNLKQVRVKLFGSEPQKMTLHVKGEREVKARDIEVPSQIEIMTPEIHIATLTDKKAELTMEFDVESGIGYEPAGQRHKEKMPIGTMALDCIFTPVRKVNYQIEDMRVGDRTDYNRLRLTLQTDGTLSPEDAFRSAINVLIKQFQSLLPESVQEESHSVSDSSEAQPVSGSGFSELQLSGRTIGALNRAGINDISQLRSKTTKELKGLKGLGSKGLNEIKDELTKIGVELLD